MAVVTEAPTAGFWPESARGRHAQPSEPSRPMPRGPLSAEPHLGADLLFGAGAVLMIEDRFARDLLAAWSAGRSSLISPGIDLTRGTSHPPEVSAPSQARSDRPVGIRAGPT